MLRDRGLFRRGGIDNARHPGNAVGRETTAGGVFFDERFVGCDVHAVEFVTGDVTLKPLHFWQVAQHIAGL
ncbi:hypothetical protein D3C84_1148290 [compost metagenome]